MKTAFWFCGRNTKAATLWVTMDKGKRKMARTSTRRDGSEAGCSVVLFFPKGALTHHLQNATHFGGGGIPTKGRAVRSPRGTRGDCAFCGKRRTMRALLLSSAQLSVLSWTAHRTARHLLLQNLPPADFANLRADVLHPVVAGHLTGHSAKRIFEMIMATEVCGHYRKRRR